MKESLTDTLEAAGKLNWCIAGLLALFGAFIMYLYLDHSFKQRQMETIQAVIIECLKK